MRNVEEIIKSRFNRSTRIQRPFKLFADIYLQCINAGKLILSDSVAIEIRPLLERSVIISMVSAIEVYYRDMLDFVFRYCAPSYFEPHLKHFLSEKYDIDYLIEVYRHQIHPLELVVSNQSFQNRRQIDKVFSKLLDSRSLWDEILNIQIRIKDEPESESSVSREDLLALDRIFNLRHQLVHDPAQISFINEEVLRDLHGSAGVILASDIVLSRVTKDHRDPTL